MGGRRFGSPSAWAPPTLGSTGPGSVSLMIGPRSMLQGEPRSSGGAKIWEELGPAGLEASQPQPLAWELTGLGPAGL